MDRLDHKDCKIKALMRLLCLVGIVSLAAYTVLSRFGPSYEQETVQAFFEHGSAH